MSVCRVIEKSKRDGDSTIQIEVNQNQSSWADDVKDCNVSCLHKCNKVVQALIFTESQRLKQIESDLLKFTVVALGDEGVLNENIRAKKREIRIPFTKLEIFVVCVSL